MSNINWDEAPEGATAYNKGTTSPWLKKDSKGDVYFYNPSIEGGWQLYTHQQTGIHHHGKATKKPRSNKPWMPEVGVECEISNCGNKFIWCIPRYIGKTLHVVEQLGEIEQHYHASSVEFRPIKTEREKFIEELKALVLNDGPMLSLSDFFGELYDAGYRKADGE